MLAQIVHHRLARQLADDLGAAEHRAPNRLLREGALLEKIVDDVVRRVVRLADLLQDDGALAFELGGVEARMQQDVCQNIERERDVLFQYLGVIGRALARGIGVEMATYRLDLLGNVAGAAPLGAFERHMLEEMRGAVDLGRLVPRPDIDPQPERNRVDRVDAIGDDSQPVRQRREIDRHAAPRFGRARCACVRRNARTAAMSFGSTVTRSRRSMMSASCGGIGGRMPAARSTGSGNFAGCAVASAIIGVVVSSFISARAAATATAVWGSISAPLSR